jgi:hypothetical protein
MKKIFLTLALSLNLLLMPIAIHAATAPCDNANVTKEIAAEFSVKFCSANQVLVWAIQFLLSIAAMVAVLFIVYGGFQYITSAQSGGEKSVLAAKSTITNSIIGLVIIILAYTIVSVVINSINSTQGGAGGTSGPAGGSTPNSAIIFSPANPTLKVDDNITVTMTSAVAGAGYDITGNSDTTVVSAIPAGAGSIVLTGKKEGTSVIKVCKSGTSSCSSLNVTVKKITGISSCDNSTSPVDINMDASPLGVYSVGDTFTQRIHIENHQNIPVKNPRITWGVRNGDSKAIEYRFGTLVITASSPNDLLSSDSDKVYNDLKSSSGVLLRQIDACGTIEIDFMFTTTKTGAVVTETHVSGDGIKTIGDPSTITIQ